ncbi:MAG: hypothetical protein IKX37_05580, partial [Bacteroidales bacterium]|nr:hypothetical protein [Bacteroidales bacterium]
HDLRQGDDHSTTKDSGLILIYRGKLAQFIRPHNLSVSELPAAVLTGRQIVIFVTKIAFSL